MKPAELEILKKENESLRSQLEDTLKELSRSKASLTKLENLAEIHLKKSEELHDDIIDLLGDGVLEINRFGLIIFYSKQLRELFDDGKRHVLDQHILSYLSPICKRRMLKEIKNLRKGHVVKEEVCFFINGEQQYYIASIKPKLMLRNGEEELTGAIASLTNITTQKNVEKELIEAKERALSATKTKSEFLSRMTHEIRTPIHAITNFTQVLIDDNPAKGQKEYLEFIRFSSENLLSIVNDVLDFNKMEAGKVVFENSCFDIQQLISAISNIFRERAEHKCLRFDTKMDKYFPQYISGDSAKLTQVLSNLLANAIKFTTKGGITLSAKILAETKDEYRLKFSIRDTGIGIAESKLEKVFKEFEQAEVYTNREYGGTGLGLAISKYFIELQKGKIHVSSQEGVGSTFEFELTFDKPNIGEIKAFAIPKHEDRKELTSTRILIVEDNHMNKLVARKILTKWGAKVDVAENGLLGCEMAFNNIYDLILMDIEMPVMNGYEAAKEIRLQNPDVPIIALTASLLSEVREHSIASGMNSFISKPFKEHELWEAISPYLHRTALRMSH